MVSSSAYPGLDRSPKENWVDRAGGLPSYIERIAKHLHYEEGMDIGHAIATAVNVVKKMCATGDLNLPGVQQVNAKSRAEACAAVAEWEAKKARARSLARPAYEEMRLIDLAAERVTFDMGLIRKVATPEGAKRYGVPIGAVIRALKYRSTYNNYVGTMTPKELQKRYKEQGEKASKASQSAAQSSGLGNKTTSTVKNSTAPPTPAQKKASEEVKLLGSARQTKLWNALKNRDWD